MTSIQPPANVLSPEAIQQLVEGHRRFLSFLERRVESREVAEDILQTAFVRCLEQGGLRDEESVVAWFYRILRNAVIDYYRHRESTGRALENWKREFAVREAADADLKNEICECLSALVGTLKPEYKKAIEVIDLGEGSLNELAGEAGITPGNAAVRVHRAREALRKQVEAACGSCAEHGCLDCDCC